MMEIARGRGRILALAAAVLAATPAAAQDLPPAAEITERYVEAVGGRAAFERLQGRHMVSEMSMPAMGMTMTVEVYQARPNLMLSKVQMPGMGEVLSGYDGTVAWSVNPMQGAQILADQELAQALQQADFDASYNFERSFTTMETVGQREVGGRACWDVRMVHQSGVEARSCFDKESGLLLATVAKQASAMGEMEVEMVMHDYQEHDGIRMPMRTAMNMAGQEMVITVKSISHEPIDASVFALPAEVRALVPAN